MKHKTANYAPGQLPREFDVVDTAPNSDPLPVKVTDDDTDWEAVRKKIRKPVSLRRWLYTFLLEFTLLVVIAGWVFWMRDNIPPEEGIPDSPAWTLNYLYH